MRAITQAARILAAVLATVFARPALAQSTASEAAQYRACLAKTTSNADAAYDDALVWRDQGGGVPAQHCAALALVALGKHAEAASRLAALADMPGGRAMAPALLGQAGNAWLLASQAALMAAVIAMGQADPLKMPLLLAGLALLVSFFSATQDIVIDAFRVESLEVDTQAAGMANFVAAYRVALLVSTAGAIEMYALLGGIGVTGPDGWAIVYVALSMLLLVGMAAVLLSKEPDGPAAIEESGITSLWQTALRPFTEFSQRQGWLYILLFVLLFKLGDAAAGVMTAPFVLDLGFEMTTYGRVVKGIGFFAVLAGGFAGGMAARSLGTVTALWIGGITQMASNGMFVWLANAGADLNLLIATIGVENFTGGFGTVVFVAYLGALCQERAYTATQFALLTSLAAVGRTALSSITGYIVEAEGWQFFFMLSTLAAVPGLVFLWWLTRRRGI